MSEVNATKKRQISKKEVLNTFSIVVANYNYADHVGQAIQGALKQSYSHGHFEVIVVDDGSTDKSRQVIADIAAKNDNLRVITQTNLGQAAAFYAGVNIAKYEWICLLDSDDYFKPEKLSVLNTYINKQQQGFDFICHDVDVIDEASGNTQSWFNRQRISGEYLSIDQAKGGYPFANPCGQIYRKSILQKIAPWLNLNDWKRGADNPLAYSALLLSGRVFYLNQTLAVYRIHANNYFLTSTPQGLIPKVNWLERWPKLLTYLNYLHQGSSMLYQTAESRQEFLDRLAKFLEFWDKKLQQEPNVPLVSFITTCKNRLHHLKQTLPRMLKQSNAEVIVVDYGCDQGTRDWVSKSYPQVKVVEVDDDEGWSAARARNLGAAVAEADWLYFIDADMLLLADMGQWVALHAVDGEMYQAEPMPSASAKGTVICQRDKYLEVGGYDEAIRGWFPEDGDFYAALEDIEVKRKGFSARFVAPIEHGDDERALGGADQMQSREQSMQVALIYRMLKVDILRLTGISADLETRKRLLGQVMVQVKKMHTSGRSLDSQVVLAINSGMSRYQSVNLDRRLVYTLRNIRHTYKTQANETTAGSANPPIASLKTADILSKTRVAMFHIGRSGSSVLADMLNQHPTIYWDGEIYEAETQAIQKRLGYFHYGSVECRYDPIELLQQRIDKHAETAYGFEVKFNQLEHCAVALDDYLTAIRRMDVDKLIVLRRNNIFRKIVSSLVAEETRVWHVGVGKKAPKKRIKINPNLLTVERKTGSLIELIDHYTQSLAALDQRLSNKDVLTLSYEEDIEADPSVAYRKVANYLGLTTFNPKIRLARTNPYHLSDVVENLDELRLYLKATPYAWMLQEENRVVATFPQIKKTVNPAPRLLLDKALSHGDDFIKFTALAHIFDYQKAKQEALRLVQIKSNFAKNHHEWIGDITLEQSLNAATTILSSTFNRSVYRERENWLGLSSGFDSRFLLYALRKSTLDYRTFTFGEPGYADYDLAALLSDRLSLNTRLVNLRNLEWSLALYEKTINDTNDKPIHARVAVADLLVAKSLNGQIGVIHGYPNNSLIGMKPFKDWQDAKKDLIKMNDQFRWHFFFDEKWLMSQFPDDPLISEESLSYHDQISLCFRTQRVRPRDFEKVQYLTPYAEDDWMSFWLHRSENERVGYDTFLKMVTNSKLDEFFDFNLLAEHNKSLNKSEQIRLIYGNGCLASRPASTSIDPFAQICFHSLYVGNKSFQEMIDDSVERLRKREVFQPAAIDFILTKFMNADPDGEKMLRGLVTCDIALESGVFVNSLNL